jgi:holin-like protein
MAGFAILVAFNLLGLALRHYGHVPLPENVIGMILLLIALLAGVVKIEWVEQAADFLLHNMMLFFAPFFVGVLPLVPVLQANLAPIAGGLIVSTFATMLAAAWLAQGLVRTGTTREEAGGAGRG